MYTTKFKKKKLQNNNGNDVIDLLLKILNISRKISNFAVAHSTRLPRHIKKLHLLLTALILTQIEQTYLNKSRL